MYKIILYTGIYNEISYMAKETCSWSLRVALAYLGVSRSLFGKYASFDMPHQVAYGK
jgi:hypothetical protein